MAMAMALSNLAATAFCLIATVSATSLDPVRRGNSDCPGYAASNIQHTSSSINANLNLAGPACNQYGSDLSNLRLSVDYQTKQRLHVKIYDAAEQVYQVPESVLPRPASHNVAEKDADLQFSMTEKPFSFAISRKKTGETLFNTSGNPLIFESQYLNLRTQLPQDPNLYGLGETTDNMRLGTSNYTRTLWTRDAPDTPQGENLYGSHPIYYDHRENGTHGVFLLNSNGMDIKISQSSAGQYLEYNTLGGVIDLYFLSGPEPHAVAKQYAEVVGKPAMMPYFGFGFHNCRYGYQDLYEVAETVANYSKAGIPLETQWTDIDYMDRRKIFSNDPYRFETSLFRELVSTLHQKNQHYVLMVDPQVAYQDYPPFNNGLQQDAFFKNSDGSIYQGVMWPGVVAYPDWLAPNTQAFWSGEFDTFFNKDTGIDIDALWIDMNEPSNSVWWDTPTVCGFDCDHISLFANESSDPPRRPPARLTAPRPIPGFGSDFQPHCHTTVNFNLKASNGPFEGILILGDAISLGAERLEYAPPINNIGNGNWYVQAELPAHGTFNYRYVRVINETLFEYEPANRTIKTGGCGSLKSTNDTITTNPIPQRKRSAPVLPAPIQQESPLKRTVTPQSGDMLGLPGRNLLAPEYAIDNVDGPALSSGTLPSNLIHHTGQAMYDTHNMYGTMMSSTSRNALLSRRPNARPLVITRSTFAGAGAHVGHWTGDNAATWDHYRYAIQQIQEFAGMFQVPMVGSDICGFNPPDTTDTLCARWVFVGAFSPFFRDHSADNVMPHPLYYSDLVAAAARAAIDVRYRLLDYAYTAFYRQSQTGHPWINPMFFMYPKDPNTLDLQWQFFYGDSLLVAPVTQTNSTEVTFYLPKDDFFDLWTYQPVQGQGKNITVTDIGYETMPLYIKGGSIIPIRTESAYTTTDLRTKNFNLIIAPKQKGAGTSKGSLYLDDGNSIKQSATSMIDFSYKNGAFKMSGSFDYNPGNIVIENIILLDQDSACKSGSYNATARTATYKVNASLRKGLSMNLACGKARDMPRAHFDMQ